MMTVFVFRVDTLKDQAAQMILDAICKIVMSFDNDASHDQGARRSTRTIQHANFPLKQHVLIQWVWNDFQLRGCEPLER